MLKTKKETKSERMKPRVEINERERESLKKREKRNVSMKCM